MNRKRNIVGVLFSSGLVAGVIGGFSAEVEGAIISVPGDFPSIQLAVNAALEGDEVVLAPGTYLGVGNRDIDFLGKGITVRSVDPADPAVVAGTVIDLQQQGRGFMLHSGEPATATIDGLTVINGFAVTGSGVEIKNGSALTIRRSVFTGHATPQNAAVVQSTLPDVFPGTFNSLSVYDSTISGNSGGGIQLRFFTSELTILGSDVSDNLGVGVETGTLGALIITVDIRDTQVNGNLLGGLLLDRVENGVVSRVTASGNGGTGLDLSEAFQGGGVSATNCTITGNGGTGLNFGAATTGEIRNCLISGNHGLTSGGVTLSGFGAIALTGNTIVNNIGDIAGGGIFAGGTEPVTIRNTILWGNVAPDGPQLRLHSGFNDPTVVDIDFSVVQGGESIISVSVVCCSPSQLIYGASNFDLDPLFVSSGKGDFHLTSGSPVIDAGDPLFVPLAGETDIDSDPRVLGLYVDLGADEFVPAQPCPGDIMPFGVGNGVVNIDDLVAVLNAFGPCPVIPLPCGADISPPGGNSVVNIDDLVAVLNAFGACP